MPQHSYLPISPTTQSARRQVQRGRKRKRAVRGGQFQLPSNRSSTDRIPKRQMKDQSADREGCFNDNQASNLIQDPDVCIGKQACLQSEEFQLEAIKMLTQQGNSFSVLSNDASLGSDEIDVLRQPSYVHDTVPQIKNQDNCVGSLSFGGTVTPPPEPNVKLFLKKRYKSDTTIPLGMQNKFTLPLSSEKQSRPIAKGSIPENLSTLAASNLQNYSPYRVPSPLLYHKRSREILTRSTEGVSISGCVESKLNQSSSIQDDQNHNIETDHQARTTSHSSDSAMRLNQTQSRPRLVRYKGSNSSQSSVGTLSGASGKSNFDIWCKGNLGSSSLGSLSSWGIPAEGRERSSTKSSLDLRFSVVGATPATASSNIPSDDISIIPESSTDRTRCLGTADEYLAIVPAKVFRIHNVQGIVSRRSMARRKSNADLDNRTLVSGQINRRNKTHVPASDSGTLTAMKAESINASPSFGQELRSTSTEGNQVPEDIGKESWRQEINRVHHPSVLTKADPRGFESESEVDYDEAFVSAEEWADEMWESDTEKHTINKYERLGLFATNWETGGRG